MGNSWRNLPGKARVSLLALDPRLRRRAEREARILSPVERELFLSLRRYDLAHSLAVASRVGREDPTLLRAALLHDVGKLRRELRVPVRYLYMLLELLFPSVLSRIAESVEREARGPAWTERLYSLPRGWKRGIFIQLHHGEVGAEILRLAGCEEEVCRLVEGHQKEPQDLKAKMLAVADDSL